MATCDALTKLNDIIKDSKNTASKEPVIDITGEENTGGSSSKIYECEKCDYKASMPKNLKIIREVSISLFNFRVNCVNLLERVKLNIKNTCIMNMLNRKNSQNQEVKTK